MKKVYLWAFSDPSDNCRCRGGYLPLARKMWACREQRGMPATRGRWAGERRGGATCIDLHPTVPRPALRLAGAAGTAAEPAEYAHSGSGGAERRAERLGPLCLALTVRGPRQALACRRLGDRGMVWESIGEWVAYPRLAYIRWHEDGSRVTSPRCRHTAGPGGPGYRRPRALRSAARRKRCRRKTETEGRTAMAPQPLCAISEGRPKAMPKARHKVALWRDPLTTP